MVSTLSQLKGKLRITILNADSTLNAYLSTHLEECLRFWQTLGFCVGLINDFLLSLKGKGEKGKKPNGLSLLSMREMLNNPSSLFLASIELSSALPFERFHRIRLHSHKDFALCAQIDCVKSLASTKFRHPGIIIWYLV
mgnify:CR=1 FL=1